MLSIKKLQKKTFDIESNIDYSEINKFIEFYKTELEKGNSNDVQYQIEINFNPTQHSEIQGEVDPLYLSYLSLFLIQFPNSSVTFSFSKYEDSNRAFSLKDQLEHLRYVLNINENQIKLNGKSKNAINELTEVSLYDYSVKTINGNLLDTKEKNDKYFLSQSQNFIPPIFINERSIKRYFDPHEKPEEQILFKKYLDKTIFEILDKVGDPKNESEGSQFIDSLEINKLNYLEVFLFRLCLKKEIYELIGKKGGGQLKKEEKQNVYNRNKTKIKYYRFFVNQLSTGLKELAKNIVEHSSNHIGIITVRIFDKERILALKEKYGDESTFIEKRDSKYYLNHNNEQFFFDINVVDFGQESVRVKYEENIKKNKETLINTVSGNKNIEISENEYLKELIGIDFDNDINNIRDKEKLRYKDFFVIDPEKNILLTHQQNKLITRIGLQYFTQLFINKFNAFIKTSSQNEGVVIYNDQDTSYKTDRFLKYGTVYNCIVPIKVMDLKIDENDSNNIQMTGDSVNIFEELNKYSIINIDDNYSTPQNNDIIYEYNVKNSPGSDRYETVIKVYFDIITKSKGIEKNVILINAQNISFNKNDTNNFEKNEGEWVRLLLTLNSQIKDIIVYNIDYHKTRMIYQYRKAWASANSNFWLEDGRVLFYSINNKLNYEFYRSGVTLFAGTKVEQYNYLNKKIWKHHYSYGTRAGFFEESKIEEPDDNIYGKHLFHNKELKYFELIINNNDKNESAISLFEQSVQYSLNKEYKPEAVGNNRGYKISNAHYRLGSKIHIKDFFYAKRLFQNSFFTTPLAYKLAEYISPTLEEGKSYSIIGYDKYSDFLVGTIRNFLSRRNPNIKLNHFTISKDGALSRDGGSLEYNTIIVVPIASTFSTSLKIKNDIDFLLQERDKDSEEKKEQEVLHYLNIVLVGHNLFDEKGEQVQYEYPPNSIWTNFNWKNINKKDKVISLLKTDESKKTIQKYFIPLYTEWQNAQECKSCFPELIKDEKCLIETGSASVTPQIIFGYPKTQIINETGNNFLDYSNSLLCDNLKKNNNLYYYFIKTGTVINTHDHNKVAIINWLKQLRLKFKEYRGSKIVIVTPSSGSKSNFIDLVNEYIFDFTANCLFISLEEDYIDTAESLYSDGLHKGEVIIYVDDVLSTIQAFLEVNYIVKYVRNKIKIGRGIDYCISLINRMSYENENDILLKLINIDSEKQLSSPDQRLFYFTKINTPSIQWSNSNFPLVSERNKYDWLSKVTSLDYVRQVFKEKKNKLRIVDLSKKIPSSTYDHNKLFPFKKLFQLLVENAIYSLFCFENNLNKGYHENYIFDQKLKSFFEDQNFYELVKYIRDEISKLPNEYKIKIISKHDKNLKYIILKILCNKPLIDYQNIRESSFNWINKELNEMIQRINDFNADNFLEFFQKENKNSFSDYQSFKFLLKRSVVLNSNIILSKAFFDAMENLINLLHHFPFELESVIAKTRAQNFNKFVEIFNRNEDNIIIQQYVYNLLESNRELFSTGIFNNFINSIRNDKKEELKNYNDLFPPDVGDLRLYVEYETSMGIIIYLVSLVQELILNHEIKSIKLENILNEIISEKNKNDSSFDNNIENGNYLHYLRYLKLENTEVLYSFWKYFNIEKRNKYVNGCLQEANKNLDICLQNNPKYKLVKQLACSKDYQIYFEINNSLEYFESKGNGNKVAEDVKSFISNNILQKIEAILGDVVESSFIINYKKKKTNIKVEDLYLFARNEKNNNGIFRKDGFNRSLTLKMFNGLNKNEKTSTFEIYKKINVEDKEGSELYYRKNILDQSVTDYYEVEILKNKEEFNLLFIRISDFYKVDNSGSTNGKVEEKHNQLYTQAVLAFYLNKGERIPEEKLRLILLLRMSLSKFLNKKILTNTFLELLQNKEIEEYQSSLKHGLSKYLRTQAKLVNDKTIYKENNEEVFQILNKVIEGQVSAYDVHNNTTLIKTKSDIEEYIKLILSTVLMGTEKFMDESIKIIFEEGIDKLEMDSLIYEIVIPQLLINIKNYAHPYNPEINIFFSTEEYTFSNNKKKDPLHDKGYGLDMCKRICKKLKYNFIDDDNYDNGKKFWITLRRTKK